MPLVLGLNGAIIVKLSCGNLKKSELAVPFFNHQEHQRKNTSRILFCLVAMFLVLNTPRAIKVAHTLTLEFSHEKQEYPPWIMILAPIYKLCLMLNSSLNFVIYCLAGDNFRKQSKSLLTTMRNAFN